MTEEENQEQSNDMSQNLVNLRKAKEEQERKAAQKDREIEEMKQEMQQLKEQYQNAQNIREQKETADDIYKRYGLKAGELAETDQIANIVKDIEKRTEERMAKTLQEQKKKEWPERLRTKYSDYDQVMTNENFEELGNKDPEFTEALMHVQDEEKRRESAYKRIKKLKKEDEGSGLKEMAEDNQKKKAAFAGDSAGAGYGSAPLNLPKTREEKMKAYQKLKQAQQRMPM